MNITLLLDKIKTLITKIRNIQFRKPTREELKTWLRESPRYIGLATLGGIALLFVIYLAVMLELFGQVPNLKELKTIEQNEASEVYSVDTVLLGRYYITNRTTVEFKDINPVMFDALVAVEDNRFYKHSGVDYRSYARVIIKSILLQNKTTGGGSTLTQQLAKNLYNRRRYGFMTMPVNKIREIVIARRIEKVYSKDEIITMYLNTVPFGENVYGINIAAKRFFNKTPKELTIEEAATLAGVLQAPSRYNPREHPDRAKLRRNVVLEQMKKYGYLQANQVEQLSKLPLKTDYQFISHSDGLAPYFRSSLKEEIKEICKDLKKADGTSYDLNTDGLKIYTTIHSKWQQYAEEAANEHMAVLQAEFTEHWKDETLWKKDDNFIVRAMKSSNRYLTLKEFGWTDKQIERNFNVPVSMDVFTWEGVQEKRMSPIDSIIYYYSLLNVGFIATDPKSGEVRAWIGGINHHFLEYDHVKAKRQAGSVFKPIVYTAALQRGYTPCSYLPNSKITYTEYQNWSPANADGQYGGYYSLQGGLAKSINTIAAQLINKVGVGTVIDLASQMGIHTPMPNEPGLALGATDVDLLELAEVFGVFANDGVRKQLHYLIKIEDKDGNVIYRAPRPAAPQKILSSDIVYQMNAMMRAVVDSGTGSALRYRYGLSSGICGKTGTSQNHVDGRFMGFTPNVVAGAWVGGATKNVRFRSLNLGNGGHMALPIWGGFYKRLIEDPSFKSWRYDSFPVNGWFSDYNCQDFTPDESEANQQDSLFQNQVDINIDGQNNDQNEGNDGNAPVPSNENQHPQRLQEPNRPKDVPEERKKNNQDNNR
jgi:penicillin-binding protein 1A